MHMVLTILAYKSDFKLNSPYKTFIYCNKYISIQLNVKVKIYVLFSEINAMCAQ